MTPKLQAAGWENQPTPLPGQGSFIQLDVAKVPPIPQHGNVSEIIGKFGVTDKLRNVVNQLQSLLYAG